MGSITKNKESFRVAKEVALVWKRPKTFMKDEGSIEIFKDRIEPDDVK